jgi:hypothetical protein
MACCTGFGVQRMSLRRKLSFSLFEIRVNLLNMGEIKRDGTVNLLQR